MYHGERVGNYGDKVVQLFKLREGREYFFAGIKHLWPGSLYEILPGDKMSSNPKRYDDDPNWQMSEKERAEYEAQKLIVKNHRALKRKDMELKKSNPKIKHAIDLLRPFYQSLDHIDQKRFMGYITNQLSKRIKK